MSKYEIHILQSAELGGTFATFFGNSDKRAINFARKIGKGRQFEVWRDGVCVTGFAHLLAQQSRTVENG